MTEERTLTEGGRGLGGRVPVGMRPDSVLLLDEVKCVGVPWFRRFVRLTLM